MHTKTALRTAVSAAGALILGIGPLAGGASAQPIPPISLGAIGQIIILPPSPCRPSDGEQRCVDLGGVLQIQLVPPSPCRGLICP